MRTFSYGKSFLTIAAHCYSYSIEKQSFAAFATSGGFFVKVIAGLCFSVFLVLKVHYYLGYWSMCKYFYGGFTLAQVLH